MNAIKDDPVAHYQHLYALHFLEGANYHARYCEKAKNQKNEDAEFEACFHAGACLEMFIDGFLAWLDPITLLISDKERKRWNPQAAEKSIVELRQGNINIQKLMRVHFRNLSDLIDDFRSTLEDHGVDTYTLPIVLQNLSEARNDITHRHYSRHSASELFALLEFLQANIETLFGEKDPRALCLSGNLSVEQSAWSRLLLCEIQQKQQVFTKKEFDRRAFIFSYKRVENELLQEAMGLPQIINSQYCFTSLVVCPICKYPAFYTQKSYPFFTAGLPDGTSTLHLYIPRPARKESLICPACSYADWDNSVIALYKDVCQFENILGPFLTKDMKDNQREINEIGKKYITHL